ncbi:hypothetical protein Kpol_1036p75 [Vanderwaltozyma polyspora DSM 70294]|uniref:RWD domain-containing protein n=1 Tax=Vanderwaltozyma polyspora (strain ATCC 22028 / DSM 70294 / BCRC 21397 / CBS 2163 / NBRC 10782 / NRRL Y-8283 / UCD 57-17) TaxID=436907 RepID=A7TEM2_VANPO|nr:uncharacterized protein Kpol_1036p75 [Vanderwaltozyma polyspora DSM 70294]EDO19329.1 hypothetical protein Kpol_1036p75 [Vanderwaltozyma polyspora DSM 70294]
MDYKEEQQQELEVLESIYPDELNVLSDAFPNVQFEVSLRLELDAMLDSNVQLNKEHTMMVNFQLPENYPDAAPIISIEAQEVSLVDDEDEAESEEEQEFDEHGNIMMTKLETLSDNISLSGYVPELQVQLEEQIENDMLLGMQMCFALLSTVKDNSENWFHERLSELEKEYEKQLEAREKEEQAKFNGTKVTRESFLNWRGTFRKELKLDERDADRRLAAHHGRLTGKQMFEQGVDGTTDDVMEDEVDEVVDNLSKTNVSN